MGYFNYRTYRADSWWEQRTFVHKWWQLQAHDRRWVPPPYPALRAVFGKQAAPHLARTTILPIYLEALPNRTNGSGLTAAYWEEPVAATMLVLDPRQPEGTAYLALLSCSNDEEALDRLLGAAQEAAAHQGYYRLVGPVGLSPWLQSGVLENYFHVLPPLHTPYNPPYLPELMASSLHAWQTTTLLHLPLATAAQDGLANSTPISAAALQVRPLHTYEPWSALLPLWQVACQAMGDYPTPDVMEVAFLQSWLQRWPCAGWVVEVEGMAVGFVVLQADLAGAVHRARGGRNRLWALWLQWRSRQGAKGGRLLYGAVLPAWQGRGIGTLLWQQVLITARQQGWQSLTIGPLLPTATGLPFLLRRGAQPQQRYITYTNEL